MSDFFNNLSLNKFHNLIIYISGIILILSLFVAFKTDITNITQLAFSYLILGFILWGINDLMYIIGSIIPSESDQIIILILGKLIYYGLFVCWLIF